MFFVSSPEGTTQDLLLLEARQPLSVLLVPLTQQPNPSNSA